jgi:hypothetical protein
LLISDRKPRNFKYTEESIAHAKGVGFVFLVGVGTSRFLCPQVRKCPTLIFYSRGTYFIAVFQMNFYCLIVARITSNKKKSHNQIIDIQRLIKNRIAS